MASQIIENDIRPLVNNGDIAGAVKIFYERSEQIIAGEYTVATQSTSQDKSFTYMGILIGFIL